MTTRSPDTTAEAEHAQIQALRALSARQRIAQVDELNALVEALILADLRRRHPEAGETQLQAWLRTRRNPLPASPGADVPVIPAPERRT